tara:strand:- start:760 stop:975 length:216 start_codon:yes stop_codon:yes gene_type:complete
MIEKFTTEILDKIVIEVKNKKNLEKINDNIVEPMIYYLLQKIYPYIIFLVILIIIIILLLILLLVIIKLKN